MDNLPFKILGIEHIAFAVKSVKDPRNFFISLLGIKNTSIEKIVDQKVNTHIFDTGSGKIELLESISDDSPISKFLHNRGDGIHHIAFKVDNLQIALEYLSNNGVELLNDTPKLGAEGLMIAFLHPKSTFGVLIELCADP